MGLKATIRALWFSILPANQQLPAPDTALRTFSVGGVGFASLFLLRQGSIGHHAARVTLGVACSNSGEKNGRGRLSAIHEETASFSGNDGQLRDFHTGI